MKKQFLILIAIFGLSFKSFAAAGSSSDQELFFLIVIGFLLVLLGIVTLFNYIRKNGKTMIYKAMSFSKKKIDLIRKYLNKRFDAYHDAEITI